MHWPKFNTSLALALALGCASGASAATTYSVLIEGDPGGLGNFVYGEFDTLTDVKNWNVSSSSFIGQNLFGTGTSVGGYTYDGSKYHALIEGDPGGLGNLVLGTFDTLTDLKNWNPSSSSFIGQNLFGTGTSVGGLAFDGSKFHALIEGDPGGLGNLVLGTFDTLTDLKNWNPSSSSFIGQNLFGTGTSVRGFEYDGSEYQVLIEGDPGGLGNLVLGSFDTLTDVKNWNVGSSSFIGQNLFGTGTSVGGFTVVTDPVSPPPIPLPAPFVLMMTAMVFLGVFKQGARKTVG